MKKELQLLGLTKNESLVYETLVKHGSSKAGSVFSKLTLHRNLIYRALDELVSNGYVTKVVRNGVWHFETTNPQSLLTSSRRREKVYKDVLREIAYYKKDTNEQVVVYAGVESFRKFWLQKVAEAPKNTIFFSVGVEFKTLFKILGPKKDAYIDALSHQRISFKSIYFGNDNVETPKDLSKVEVKTYTSSQNNSLGNFTITHNAVVLEVLDERPRIIEMRDPALVTTFKGYFNVMWGK